MKTALLCWCLLLGRAVHAQPGTPDPAFGNGGRAFFRYHQPYAILAEALLTPTDQVVAAGFSYYNGDLETVLTRYTANGTPDTAFGTNGLVRLNFKENNFDDAANAMVQLPDGRLIVCMDNDTTVRLVRLKTNGTIDSTFGSAAGQVVPLDGLKVSDMQLRSDGRLLLVGEIKGVPSLVQLTGAGLPDAGFGSNGVETIGLEMIGDYYVASLLIMPDERILMSGARRAAPGELYKPFVARLLENATADLTFSLDGWMELAGEPDRRYNEGELKLHSDGRIFMAGLVDDLSSNFSQLVAGFYVACIGSNGVLDASFGTGGLVKYSATSRLLLGGLQLQPDGKLLLTGGYRNGSDYEFGVLRLLGNGAPDAAFGNNGLATQNASAGFDYGFTSLRQSSGSYVVLGGGVVQQQFSLSMLRLGPGGQPDAGFGNSGVAQRTFGEGLTAEENNVFAAVAATSLNQAVVAGYFNNGQFTSGMLARYTTNGLLDAAFGQAGVADASFAVADALLKVQVLPDGKLLAAGTSYDLLEGSALVLARFLPDGSLDPSFGTRGKLMLFFGANFQISPAEFSMALMPDGAISMAVGLLDLINFSNVAKLLRLTASGQPDISFGSGGMLTTAMFFSHLAAQPDGKLVASGVDAAGNPAEGQNVYTTRLLLNGSTDPAFNGGQLLSTHFSEEADFVAGLLVQPGTGKIVLGVNSRNSATVGNTSVAVYNSNGTPDNSFGTNGRTNQVLPFDPVLMLQASDGSLLMGSNDFSLGTGRIALARLSSTGVVDAAFGTNGSAFYTALPVSDNEAWDMALQPDGKVLLSGWFVGETDNAYRALVLRINTTAATSTAFSFTGNGLWSNAANWSGGVVPPNPLPAGATVSIQHLAGGQCVLDVPIAVQPGASITVPAGKVFRAAANISLPAITVQ